MQTVYLLVRENMQLAGFVVGLLGVFGLLNAVVNASLTDFPFGLDSILKASIVSGTLHGVLAILMGAGCADTFTFVILGLFVIMPIIGLLVVCLGVYNVVRLLLERLGV